MGVYELEFDLKCLHTYFDDHLEGRYIKVYEGGIYAGHKLYNYNMNEFRTIAFGLKHPDGLGLSDLKKVTARLYVNKYIGAGNAYAGVVRGNGFQGETNKERWNTIINNGSAIILSSQEGNAIEEIEITDTETLERLFDPLLGFGIHGKYLTEEPKSSNYVEFTNLKFIAEYKDKYSDPSIDLRKDLMENGGFYPEDRAMDYYQYVDKEFRISWDYSQEAGAAVKETRIHVKTIGTNDGTPTQEWDINEYTYNGNTGTVIIPDYVWKRLPCGGWVEITVISEMGKSASLQLWFDVPFYEVEIIQPVKDSIIKYDVGNLLQWVKKDISGFVAFPAVSGYRILISTNNGATFDPIVEITGDIQEYLFREETLPVGVVSVRVVALYDNNTVAQNLQFGESRYIVGADATTSTVTCDGKPIPTVAWESVAQTACQVKFGDYDSGAVYSADKYHKIPYIFSDGVYDVTVRTQISTGEWSEWSEPVYVQITNVPPGLGITATAEPAGHRVKVVWTKNSGYVDYIVYRNDVPIHITDGGISTDGGYMDSMANGVSVYMVRGITADGYYDQSAEITVNAAVSTDILFALGSDEILPLKYTPVFPRTYNYAAEMAVTYRYFAGRSKPVAITSGQISRTLPLSYIDKGRTLARKLLSYVGKTVVFKDSGGDMIVGVLNMANASMGHVSTTSFQITEVDYNERVAYLPGE